MTSAFAGRPFGAARGADERRSVRIDLVQLFLRQWRSALLALLALAVVTVAVFVAGRSLAAPTAWAVWGLAAAANTLAQAAVCRAMDAVSPQDAADRWAPWLLLSIGINGVVWGALPLLLENASARQVVLACLFNAMLLFCICNAPGTLGMRVAAGPPLGLLGSVALLERGMPHASLGYALLVATIVYHGVRVLALLGTGITARRAAERLSEELRTQQQRLLEAERERALLLERQRLTREMHDGLGSTLVALLAAVQRGEVGWDRLGAMLRDCVDDLRSVMDSLQAADHDLEALLAALRARLERQLEAAGIRLLWEMDDLPPLAWMGPPETLQVMRFVQEVVANVLKHAGASQVQLAARAAGDQVEVSIADDGRGFDVAAAREPGRGLCFLQQRAAALHGEATVESQPGVGTTVRLRLPVAACRPDLAA